MASGNIKGITIEFQGNTTKLDKALKQVNKETKDIDKELRNVNKSLKFNPTNVELWRQKQQLLTQKVSETKDKLDILKQAQDQMDAAGVDKNSAEYRNLQREIIETESKVKHFEGELRKVGNADLKALSEQVKQVGTSLEDAGRKMAPLSTAGAAVAGGLGALAYKAGTTADELNTMSKVYGISTAELQKYALAAEQVDVPVETIAKSHAKLEKQMMSAQKGTGAAADAFKALGVDVTNADGSLRDGDTVWQETIAALGNMTNETERDAMAMQLMGKSAMELNPLIEDGGETYQRVADLFAKYNLDVVDQETLDKANEFNDYIDDMKSIGMLTFQILGSQLAEQLAPALEKVVGWVGKLAEWLAGLDPKVLTVIGTIAALVAGLAPVLIIVGKVATGISAIISLIGVIGPAIMTLATGPVGIIVAAIAAAIAIGVALYKNWDKIKAFAVTVWGGIKDAITKPIKAAMDFVKKCIDKIKSFFKFHVELPHIKLPHFAIKPKGWKLGDLLKGSIPTLGIEWYAKGGIFNSPSVIGVGEAGAEAVIPIDRLQGMLTAMADDIVNGMTMGMRLAASGEQTVTIPIYLYPNGAKMGEETVRIYDQYKKILG